MKFSIQTLAIALSVSVGSCQVLRKNRHQKQRHLIDNNGVEQLKELAKTIGDELGVDIDGLAAALKGSLQIDDETNLGPSSLVGMMKGNDDTTSLYSRSSKSGKSCKSQKELPPLVSRVYTASNQPNNNNEVNVYERDLHTGKLSFIESVATGGSGNQLTSPPNGEGERPAAVDDPLASTGSVVVAGKCLLVVNAGSESVTSFRISEQNGLDFVQTISSGGTFPVSIAEREGLVYVLNAVGISGDGRGSIRGFELSQFNCRLSPIGSPIALDQAPSSPPTPILTATPAQIGFTPENNILLTIKQNGGGDPDLANKAGSLNVYEIDQTTGLTSTGMLTQTILTTTGTNTGTGNGTIPFSYTYDDEGNLLLVEVAGNGGVFPPVNGGQVNVISDIDTSPVVGSEEATDSTASCWIEYNPLLSCVYVTNNIGNSISSFKLSDEQELDLVSNETASLNAPIDMVQSPDFKYLYALSTGHTGETEQTPLGQPSIYVYEMECDCTLKEIQVVTDGFLNETVRNETDGAVNGYAGLSMYTGPHV